MIDKLISEITQYIIITTMVLACIFCLLFMANSFSKFVNAKNCSEAGGIPVEVANYIHCHE